MFRGNKDIGNFGEETATNYLLQKQFTILHRNWRSSYYEIDIVALFNNCLHFVEVKTSQSLTVTEPEKNVTASKMKKLKKAIDHYLLNYPHYTNFQIDVIAIRLYKNTLQEIMFIEDVFF